MSQEIIRKIPFPDYERRDDPKVTVPEQPKNPPIRIQK